VTPRKLDTVARVLERLDRRTADLGVEVVVERVRPEEDARPGGHSRAAAREEPPPEGDRRERRHRARLRNTRGELEQPRP
jgi:hypothetical protein